MKTGWQALQSAPKDAKQTVRIIQAATGKMNGGWNEQHLAPNVGGDLGNQDQSVKWRKSLTEVIRPAILVLTTTARLPSNSAGTRRTETKKEIDAVHCFSDRTNSGGFVVEGTRSFLESKKELEISAQPNNVRKVEIA